MMAWEWEYVTIFAIMLVSVICHECAHGLVAFWRGDPTARMAGRLTLNPLKHIDPVGTILVPFALRLMGLTPLGWARPVPVNFARLYHPRQDMVWVALAGPGINMVIALAGAGVLEIWALGFPLRDIVEYIVVINLVLAVFNLIPIPPLDGSRVVAGVLSKELFLAYAKMERFGIIILIVLLNLGLFQLVLRLALWLAAILGVRT